MLAVY